MHGVDCRLGRLSAFNFAYVASHAENEADELVDALQATLGCPVIGGRTNPARSMAMNAPDSFFHVAAPSRRR